MVFTKKLRIFVLKLFVCENMYPTNSHLYNPFTNYIDISLFIPLVLINVIFIESLKPIAKPYTSISNPWNA